MPRIETLLRDSLPHGQNRGLQSTDRQIRHREGSHQNRLKRWGTKLGDHGYFPLYLALSVVCGWFVAARGRSGEAFPWLTALAVLSVGYALEGVLLGALKPWLDFPRPLLALPAGSVHVIGHAEFRHSLPSGHSAFAMLIAASLWPQANLPARLGLLVFALWVGLSRISLGAHFPADVVAGFILSLMIVWLLRALAKRLSTN